LPGVVLVDVGRFTTVKIFDAAVLTARALRKIAVTPLKHPPSVRPTRVSLDDLGSVRQTSGIWMSADDSDRRAASEQLGNERASDIARRSGDQDYVNSFDVACHQRLASATGYGAGVAHVHARTDRRMRGGEVGLLLVGEAGDAEVAHLYRARGREENVGRLDVPMYHPLGVRHGERVTGLAGDVAC